LLVWLIEEAHKSSFMTKSSFLPIFELQQIGDEWQFRVHCAEGAKEYIKGFKSRVDAEKWAQAMIQNSAHLASAYSSRCSAANGPTLATRSIAEPAFSDEAAQSI
jgi:hypothetical protein